MRQRRHCKGFTLIELLVVIGLLGVVTTLGMSILFSVSGVWKQMSIRAELDARADAVFDAMQRDFSEIVASSLSGAPVRGAVHTAKDDRFFGVPLQDDQITIPAALPPEPGASLRRVDIGYAIDRKNGSHSLVRTTTLVGAEESKTAVTVADGVLAMAIEYREKGPGSAWQAPWYLDTLPGAIRVSVTLIDPNRPNEQLSRMAVFPIYVD
ncbi:MAG: prepilin-type N-terminal cleavage/methylation domain-containing protein [Nitrospiraceae bacterium]|nr:prepilin-type N-terminal cleavage/methylation domain-containing protein [Nitrospiraceae bacterium]